MNRRTSRILWFVTGLSLGTGAGILCAPLTGRNARRMIGKKAGHAGSYIAQGGREYLDRGRHLYEKGRKMTDEAAALFEEGKRLMEEADQRKTTA